MLDGVDGGLTGVMLLHGGRILGGDAILYLGSYTSANGRWKGQILNQEHTPAKDDNRSSAATRSGSDFPAPATVKARCWTQPRWPASAACG